MSLLKRKSKKKLFSSSARLHQAEEIQHSRAHTTKRRTTGNSTNAKDGLDASRYSRRDQQRCWCWRNNHCRRSGRPTIIDKLPTSLIYLKKKIINIASNKIKFCKQNKYHYWNNRFPFLRSFLFRFFFQFSQWFLLFKIHFLPMPLYRSIAQFIGRFIFISKCARFFSPSFNKALILKHSMQFCKKRVYPKIKKQRYH